MGEELEKLKKSPNPANKDGTSGISRGFKKRYFLQNIEVIFDLVENHGIKYPQLLDAMSREGVDFNYDYLRRLMAAAKRKRESSSAPNQTSNQGHTPGHSNTPSPVASTAKNSTDIKEDMPPEKAALIAEIARIKTLNISSKEKREMIDKATQAYSKTLNPLDRK
jgi:hypothetical protein